jgi:hypothetical protein
MAKIPILCIFALALALIGLTNTIYAGVPGTMNYQGRLTTTSGDVVTDGPHSVTFRIYDQTDSVIWEETHIVVTAGGLFSAQLGSKGAPLTPDIFSNPQCWLGITVGTDPELLPRTPFNTVPYAFKTGSLQSLDIIDEPGVAAYVGDYYIYLEDSTYDVICSLTINCPAAGYVMAVAHGRIAALPQHIEGTNSYAVVGISDDPTLLPGNQDLDFHIDGAAPTGIYSIPFGMTSMFTVPIAGAYTYYMLGFEYSGSISVADIQFNLVYFPTAYGTVDPVPSSLDSWVGDDSACFDGLESEQAEAGLTRSGSVDISRLERELDDLKARIEEIQRQIGSGKGEQR